MARNPVRDERQGDLFGAPPPPAKPARRTPAPKRALEEVPAPAPVSLTSMGESATRPEIDAFLDSLPDEALAYLALEATRVVKRRLAQAKGRGLRPKGAGRTGAALDDALSRVGRELMEADQTDGMW